MDIGQWLRGLGLQSYEQAFHDNGIDLDVLPRLTADDLKEIGVLAVGHRRKLLDAIGMLGATRRLTSLNLTFPDHAERRQLTVIFCDLVGSTALSARLDPEDLQELLSVYHSQVKDAIRAYGGYIAKSWVTACSSTSVIRKPTKMTPNVRSGPASRWSRASDSSTQPEASRSARALKSPPGWWLSAI